MSTSTESQPPITHTPLRPKQQQQVYEDCLPCRIVGTAALGGVGIYALAQSRPHQPGSVVGKRILAGLGVCFLVASALRWTK